MLIENYWGNEAVWVRPENANDIAVAIDYCINNKETIDEFRMTNFNKVVENYTWDKVALKYVTYVKSILNE